MGLLSRASQELAQPAAGPPVAGGLGLSLPVFDAEAAGRLVAELPRLPLLGLRCPLRKGGASGAAGAGGAFGPALAAALSRALGPEGRLYLEREFILAFSPLPGDWDPELVEAQLLRILPRREGRPPEALEFRRFEPGTSALEGELLGFARA